MGGGKPAEPDELTFVAQEPIERLDKWLVRALANADLPVSRAVVQRWIEEERVSVGGARCRASSSLPAGAKVSVRPVDTRQPTAAEPDPSIALDIVHEDAHLLVVDKPPHLVVHPARGHERGTLVNALLAHSNFELAPESATDAAGYARPGIVHRLDKGTSGLLVVAKDDATREALKTQFAAHSIEREYVAITVGAAKAATYDTLHGRHPKDRLRFTTRVKEGRRAVTHISVIEPLGPATLVRCVLETGRTHQIRVHLCECGGTPILGDPVYGRRPRDANLAKLADTLGRQALHARVLGFIHPATGKKVRWERSVPKDFEAALLALRG
ncbi:MAG: RluA family pseudouridine synthase [Deltaproteobacteria bacterium]|nr:RluA family pseudouridine synthase [Deltaproteobacteria bacterium]